MNYFVLQLPWDAPYIYDCRETRNQLGRVTAWADDKTVSPPYSATEFKASSTQALARAEIPDRLSEKYVLHQAKGS